jgi:2,4-dienoyl-CoA reductase-like NADH-dependent reductase (Old Yellow Enzyme family)
VRGVGGDAPVSGARTAALSGARQGTAGRGTNSALFEPTTIREMELANRFVRSATWEVLADPDGRATPALVRLYQELAAGKVGLIISSHAFVSPEGRAVMQQLGAHDDAMIPALRELAGAVHDAGGKIALQLAHGGLWSLPGRGAANGAGGATADGAEPTQPLGPSVRQTEAGPVGREMSHAHIAAVTQAFAAAAARAKTAGCDVVQIHAAHGYLLSEFLSPFFNQRHDEYGGNVAARARFAVEVVAAVREAVGPDFPVLIKMNSEDFIPGGLTVDDMLESAALIAAAGVDAIELSGGTSLSGELGPLRTRTGIPRDREAYYEGAALMLKQKVSVPVMLVGGIRTFEAAERLVEQGYADYIALSRPFICEPDLVARWERGDRAPSVCRSDNRCFYKGLKREGIQCPHVQRGATGFGASDAPGGAPERLEP